jgi:pimeloyl-ACP methyl ester carboxylesterase
MQRSSSLSAGFHHALAVAASPHRLELVLRIAAPTLVIHGRHDPLLPLPHGNYLAHHIPHAQLEVLDMGHTFMWSWDAEVLGLVQGFINQNPTQPTQNVRE